MNAKMSAKSCATGAPSKSGMGRRRATPVLSMLPCAARPKYAPFHVGSPAAPLPPALSAVAGEEYAPPCIVYVPPPSMSGGDPAPVAPWHWSHFIATYATAPASGSPTGGLPTGMYAVTDPYPDT